MVDDSFYMNLCLKEAWKYQGQTYPNPAVGSLILDKNGKIAAIEAHQTAGGCHAELNAIEKALIAYGDTKIAQINTPVKKHQYILKNHKNLFLGSTIYVTLEPCNHDGQTPPCSTLIKELGFKKVIIGTLDLNKEAGGGAKELELKGIKVIKGILKKECEALLEPFKKWQEKSTFIFFKLAITQNGVFTGGIISSQESRTLVHKLRSKIDLLIIGGNTVRVDRPTLDCRLSGGKAPDILIYSKHDDFDETIPLFQVKGRKVFIENTLERLKEYRFIMIEGGEGMLKATLPILEHILLFTSEQFKKGDTLQLDFELESLNADKINSDTIEWFRKI